MPNTNWEVWEWVACTEDSRRVETKAAAFSLEGSLTQRHKKVWKTWCKTRLFLFTRLGRLFQVSKAQLSHQHLQHRIWHTNTLFSDGAGIFKTVHLLYLLYFNSDVSDICFFKSPIFCHFSFFEGVGLWEPIYQKSLQACYFSRKDKLCLLHWSHTGVREGSWIFVRRGSSKWYWLLFEQDFEQDISASRDLTESREDSHHLPLHGSPNCQIHVLFCSLSRSFFGSNFALFIQIRIRFEIPPFSQKNVWRIQKFHLRMKVSAKY